MYCLYFLNKEYNDNIIIDNKILEIIFSLDAREYPILSSLSLDDYDIFSGHELILLNKEIEKAKKENLIYSNEFDKIKIIIDKAIHGNIKIIFDPFIHH